MTTGTHYTTRDHAEAHLLHCGWTEVAVNTWHSPDGGHVASFAAFCGAVIEVHVRENA